MKRDGFDRAMECRDVSRDWTAIGARILQTAAAASAIHAMENANRLRGGCDSEEVNDEYGHSPTRYDADSHGSDRPGFRL